MLQFQEDVIITLLCIVKMSSLLNKFVHQRDRDRELERDALRLREWDRDPPRRRLSDRRLS